MKTGMLFIVCFAAVHVWASTNIDPTNKYAWTENTGWGNAAPTNGGVTVHFDGSNGYLTGLAWKEYVADTDPTNATSYFYIDPDTEGLSSNGVTFLSSSRRYYTLQRRDDLLAGNWTNVPGQIDVQGTGGTDHLQDPTTATSRYYRVKVKVSP